MEWSYGVTTVRERLDTLLPRTLESLAKAGFEKPRLFVDGGPSVLPDRLRKYECTVREPRLRTHGNWVLSAYELYIRQPLADRYAVFQDDFVTCSGLREYLESCQYPVNGYWNLYLFPENHKEEKRGWYIPDQQKGLGAVALIFDNDAIRQLLAQEHLVNRPLCVKRGWRAVDGGIVTSMNKAGRYEYVHSPALIQHTGDVSSMENGSHAKAPNFVGEAFDARSLIVKKVKKSKVHSDRIGLLGYNCRTGLGELNRQIATYADIDTWMAIPHARQPMCDFHEDIDTWVCKGHDKPKLSRWLKQVDVVVFCETEYISGFINMCRAEGKATVCVPMMEWMPAGAKGWPQHVDLFLCPTKQCYNLFSHVVPCRYYPWPVDVNRFQFQQRDKCRRFLFVNGNGGWGGRKGADVIKRAKQLWPDMPLIVCSQKKDNWPKGTLFQDKVDSNSDLYGQGDVLIAPHYFDGLGLEPMEAMASGMPVISTEGEPWNEIPAISRIPSSKQRRKVRRPVDWYTPHPEALVEICRSLLGSDVSEESRRARHWAESVSWSEAAGREFNEIVRETVSA